MVSSNNISNKNTFICLPILSLVVTASTLSVLFGYEAEVVYGTFVLHSAFQKKAHKKIFFMHDNTFSCITLYLTCVMCESFTDFFFLQD